jgi:hypothetical protein
MAATTEDKQKQDSQHEKDEHGRGSTALKAAAAAAATGAAAVALKKALSGNGAKSDEASERQEKSGQSGSVLSNVIRRDKSGQSGSVISNVMSGGWDAARDALIPVAEDAAHAAGAYVAQNAPEVVRDRIVPRFISAFNDAREED